jgi:putative redox protein
MEMLLGLCGCSAFDVVLILRKGRQQVTDSKVFTQIHVHFTVTGKALDTKRVEQAVHLSAKKYCSASIMLGKTAEISHDFEIKED